MIMNQVFDQVGNILVLELWKNSIWIPRFRQIVKLKSCGLLRMEIRNSFKSLVRHFSIILQVGKICLEASES